MNAELEAIAEKIKTDVDMTRYNVEQIDMKSIFADPEFNCRGMISPMEVMSLAKDIQERGLDSPILLQPYSIPGKPEIKYRVVAGHRRHKAFMINMTPTIPAYVRHDLDDLKARMLNLRENMHRKDLNMKQEAHALMYFVDYKKPGNKTNFFTTNDLAQIFGQSRGWVENRTNLLKLPEDIQDEVAAGILTAKHVTLLARLPNNETRYAAVRKIKTQMENGEKVLLAPPIVNRKDVTRTKERKKAEIFDINSTLYDKIGPSLPTRCLAWAAGEISTLDLFKSVEDYCREKGIPYEHPKFIVEFLEYKPITHTPNTVVSQ